MIGEVITFAVLRGRPPIDKFIKRRWVIDMTGTVSRGEKHGESELIPSRGGTFTLKAPGVLVVVAGQWSNEALELLEAAPELTAVVLVTDDDVPVAVLNRLIPRLSRHKCLFSIIGGPREDGEAWPVATRTAVDVDIFRDGEKPVMWVSISEY